MKFIHHDLGRLGAGDIVEITLSGSAANVRLLDSSNLGSFRAGRRHTYIGGLAKQSPVRLQIPNSGHWHVAVDMTGLRGTIRSSARVLPRALPPLRQTALPSIAPLVQRFQSSDLPEGDPMQKNYDVFISHATEDKEAIVRPLAHALREAGLRVWYDEFELRIGDSLRRKIDQGLANSRFGVVVLSPNFFAKNWPQYELDGLVTREMTGQQVILPLWHNISKSEIIAISPSLADKVARSTSAFTVDEIANEIAFVINSESVTSST